MIDLGNRRELFIDHALIDHQNNTRLRLHHPQPASRALTFDQPWEGSYSGYVTVLQADGRYLLYYRGWPVVKDETAAVCYATSDDGITFTRPELGIVEAHGSKANNILRLGTAGSHNFAPFLDTRPGVPEDERFKATGTTRADDRWVLLAFASADGIHWRRLQDEPLPLKGAFDSQNVAFWSATEECYVCYYRTWHNPKGGEVFEGARTVSRTTSDDFITWSEAEEVSYGDTPREQLYTNQTIPYPRAPHIYIALPMRFHPNRGRLSEEQAQEFGIEGNYWKELGDGVFMTSRGGTLYDRTFMEAFLRPGPDLANWVSRTNMSAHGIHQTGPRELSLYYQHRYAQPTAYLQRYTLRLDGFASVNAPYGGGDFITQPFTFAGKELELNVATAANGYVRVEILDEAQEPIDGYTLEDTDELFGDDIDRLATWRGSNDVSQLAGRPVRLRFHMKDADLYAFTFN